MFHMKLNRLVDKSRNKEVSLVRIFVSSCRVRFQRVIRWVHFLVDPNFDYMSWRTRDYEDSLARYAVHRNSNSNYFLWNLIDPETCNSVLEIGSNSGNRIIDFARRFPSIVCHGFDVNAPAVELGNQFAQNENISNLAFFVHDLSNLNIAGNSVKKKYDLVFSWATLIYIHPRDISECLQFMVDSCTNRLIIIEQHSFMKTKFKAFAMGLPVFLEPTWKRNYPALISTISNRKFRHVLIPVPESVWKPGGGCAYALIIDFEKE